MIKQKKRLLFLFAALGLFASCSQNDVYSEVASSESTKTEMEVQKNVDVELNAFATALSKAVYQSKGVRSLLKEEALKKFDTDYDVLYYPLRNAKVDGDKTLRDVLVENSSESVIASVEENLPLLNILIPRIAFSNVHPENLDVTDNELPVAVNNEKSVDLYVNGEVVEKIADTKVPAFNVIVVNQNKVVKANASTPTRAGGDKWTYTFIDEAFNNTASTRARGASGDGYDHSKLPAEAYKRAIAAYDAGFSRGDTSAYQAAFQRDHIYYGMTPTKRQGALNHNVTEYLVYMTVNPNCFTTISDQVTKNNNNDDPYITASRVTNKKRALTEEELVQRMWSSGAYKFIFEYNTSNSSLATKISATVYPEDLWNFNLRVDYRHSTGLRRSKYYYYIEPRKFTSKKYYFSPTQSQFGKWNLANESLTRYISVYELDDEGVMTTSTVKEIFQYVGKSSFKGDVKLNLGLAEKDNATIGVGGEVDYTNSHTKEWTFSYSKNEKNEMLAEKVPVYFYDPIILGRDGNSYIFKEYGAGDIKFAIDAR